MEFICKITRELNADVVVAGGGTAGVLQIANGDICLRSRCDCFPWFSE